MFTSLPRPIYIPEPLTPPIPPTRGIFDLDEEEDEEDDEEEEERNE